MAEAPDPKLAEQFRLLDEKIDAVLGVVRKLRQENERLAQELAELRGRQEQAVRRINVLLDRIDAPE